MHREQNMSKHREPENKAANDNRRDLLASWAQWYGLGILALRRVKHHEFEGSLGCIIVP